MLCIIIYLLKMLIKFTCDSLEDHEFLVFSGAIMVHQFPQSVHPEHERPAYVCAVVHFPVQRSKRCDNRCMTNNEDVSGFCLNALCLYCTLLRSTPFTLAKMCIVDNQKFSSNFSITEKYLPVII